MGTPEAYGGVDYDTLARRVKKYLDGQWGKGEVAREALREELERTFGGTDIYAIGGVARTAFSQVLAAPTGGGVIPRPKGGIIKKGNITTGASYATVASHTVTNGKTFQLAKILISCDQDVMFKIRWAGSDLGIEVYVAAKTPYPDWFPWDYSTMVGGGGKAIDIQAKYPTGGSAGACYAEIDGEEV